MREFSKNANSVIITGGLGNQLFQYATALFVFGKKNFNLIPASEIPNFGSSRKFSLQKLDIGESHELRIFNSLCIRIFKIALLNEKSNVKTLRRLINIVVSNIYFLDSLLKLKLDMILTCHNIELDDSKVRQSKASRTLVGYFQSVDISLLERIFPDMEKLFEGKFTIDSEVKKELMQSSSLFVHIRLGDYVTDKKLNTLSKDYYANAIELAFQEKGYDSIWLFTDGGDEALNLIPTKYHSKVYVVDHYRDSDVMTLELMRMGSGYVISNSTLSWWAAVLKYDKGASVFSPNEWFAESNIIHPQNLPTWKVL